jgi:DNA-binding CsgD family transcriptional regulator
MMEARCDGLIRRPFTSTKGSVMTMAKNSRGPGPQNGGPPPFDFPTADNVALQHDIPPLAGDPQDGAAEQVAAAGGDADSVFSRQVRMAFGLLQTAIEEATDAAECNNVKIASELEDLQARAIRSIHDSALATIDLFEAISAAKTPGDLADRQMQIARRQRETVSQRLGDFFESARTMVSMMTDPLNRQLRAISGATNGPFGLGADRGPVEAGDSILCRLNKLTTRQKRVLELLAEGLPNKVIAHQLGISETTVKAHVGEILRKLKVYNRARAIVMLAQFDLSQIRALPLIEGVEAN